MNKDCICGYNRKDLNGFPPQHQREQPGLEYLINPLPVSEWGEKCGKLEGKARNEYSIDS